MQSDSYWADSWRETKERIASATTFDIFAWYVMLTFAQYTATIAARGVHRLATGEPSKWWP